ncbi:MAG: hypothetical protein AAFQ83_25155 [Bacteroidota bacterium]
MKKPWSYLFLIVILSVGYIAYWNLSEKPNWKVIVSENFIGNVQIICNQDSVLLYHEADPSLRKLVIPESGILHLAYCPERFISGAKFYYATDEGELREIDIYDGKSSEEKAIQCLEHSFVGKIDISNPNKTQQSFHLTFVVRKGNSNLDCEDL